MPSKVVRQGDPISCGDRVATGSKDVFVNNKPMVRRRDRTTGHGWPSVLLIPVFSSTVFCNNKPIALVGKTRIPTHCKSKSGCHSGVVSDGSPDVFSS